MTAIPLPSEHTRWPAWFYPRDTDPHRAGEFGRVFKCAEDVPEGWVCDLKHVRPLNERAAPAAPTPAALTRKELFAELQKRDIPCSATLGTSALQALLDQAIADEALEASV